MADDCCEHCEPKLDTTRTSTALDTEELFFRDPDAEMKRVAEDRYQLRRAQVVSDLFSSEGIDQL